MKTRDILFFLTGMGIAAGISVYSDVNPFTKGESSNTEIPAVAQDDAVNAPAPTPALAEAPKPLIETEQESVPDNYHYEQARTLAKQGEIVRAIQELHDAFSVDETLIDYALKDDALKVVREHEEFKKVIETYRNDK